MATEIVMVLFKWSFGFTIWLLVFDLIFFHRQQRLRCGSPLVLISSVNVKFEHEVSVGQILSLKEPPVQILTLVNCILRELHPARFLLTTCCLGVLVILIAWKGIEQKGVCVLRDAVILLNCWFFVGRNRRLITNGGLDVNWGVFFGWLKLNFRITARPFLDNLCLVLEDAISYLAQVKCLPDFGFRCPILFSCS